MQLEDSIVCLAKATSTLQLQKLTPYKNSYHTYCKVHSIRMGGQLTSVVYEQRLDL